MRGREATAMSGRRIDGLGGSVGVTWAPPVELWERLGPRPALHSRPLAGLALRGGAPGRRGDFRRSGGAATLPLNGTDQKGSRTIASLGTAGGAHRANDHALAGRAWGAVARSRAVTIRAHGARRFLVRDARCAGCARLGQPQQVQRPMGSGAETGSSSGSRSTGHRRPQRYEFPS